MKAFYDSLSEKDRRRYAAIEAAKLGHGGIEYIATVLGCDPKTIRHGQQELDHLPGRTRATGPKTRGWTQTLPRHHPRSGGELPASSAGPHGGRPDAAGGEVDRPDL